MLSKQAKELRLRHDINRMTASEKDPETRARLRAHIHNCDRCKHRVKVVYFRDRDSRLAKAVAAVADVTPVAVAA